MNVSHKPVGLAVFFVLSIVCCVAAQAQVTVNCTGSGSPLQTAVNSATPGTSITVTGTCAENVVIRNDVLRISLNGGGTAILSGANTSPVLNVRGKGITITGFTITGGRDGVHVNRGSNAVIQSNVIQSNARHGILVDQLGFAVILGNTVQNNTGNGIVVSENSIARIGFSSDADTAASANTILNNGGNGIVVSRTSSARIVGNVITGNAGGYGIQAARLSQIELAKNTVNNHATNGSDTGHAVFVTQNSGVNLPDVTVTGSIFDDPNDTSVLNAGVGIRCTLGAYASGHTGGSGTQLRGSGGATNTDSNCPVGLITP